MKNLKLLIYVSLCLMTLSACKKDKDEDPKPSFPPFENSGIYGPKSEFLTGAVSKTWKMQSLLVGGQPVPASDTACVNGLRLTFYKQNYLYTSTVPPIANCQSANGQWNFNSTETELRIYTTGSGNVIWQILELSDSVFHYITPGVVNNTPTSAVIKMIPA